MPEIICAKITSENLTARAIEIIPSIDGATFQSFNSSLPIFNAAIKVTDNETINGELTGVKLSYMPNNRSIKYLDVGSGEEISFVTPYHYIFGKFCGAVSTSSFKSGASRNSITYYYVENDNIITIEYLVDLPDMEEVSAGNTINANDKLLDFFFETSGDDVKCFAYLIDENSVQSYNAFLLKNINVPNEPFIEMTFIVKDIFYSYYIDDNILYYISYVLKDYDPNGDFRCSVNNIVFDDEFYNGNVSLNIIGANTTAFFLNVYNNDLADNRIIKVNYDGNFYTLLNIDYETFDDYPFTIFEGSYYSLGAQSIISLSVTNNLNTKTNIPVTLPCISPCIPLIQE